MLFHLQLGKFTADCKFVKTVLNYTVTMQECRYIEIKILLIIQNNNRFRII